MDFGWTAQDATYRERVRAFLERELPGDWRSIARHGPGSRQQTDFSRVFCPKLAAEGLLVPHWPREWGGGGGTVWEHFILGEEMWAAGEPRGPQYMNVNWIGPTLMRFGSPEQQQRYERYGPMALLLLLVLGNGRGGIDILGILLMPPSRFLFGLIQRLVLGGGG